MSRLKILELDQQIEITVSGVKIVSSGEWSKPSPTTRPVASRIPGESGGNGIFLIWPQGSGELHVERCAAYPWVIYVAADAVA